MDIDFETGAPVNINQLYGKFGQRPSEFFQALYWKFEGRMIRLTTYDERNLPDAKLTDLAFKRARTWRLNPVYMQVYNGSFLRFGPDNTIAAYDTTGGYCEEPPNV